jgi:hypothetical protein
LAKIYPAQHNDVCFSVIFVRSSPNSGHSACSA